MYIEITFDDGTSVQASLSNSHTLRVIGPDGSTENAWALGGVKSIDLHQGEPDVPAVPDPTAQTAGDSASTEPGTSDASASSDGSHQPADSNPDVSGDGPQQDAAVADASATTADVAEAAVATATQDPSQAQTALADIEAALAEYPDDQHLLDAKAQLEQLAAEKAA